MVVILLFFLANVIYTLFSILGFFFSARILGAPISSVNLFSGKQLYSRMVGTIRFSLRSIPIGGSVQLVLWEDYYQENQSICDRQVFHGRDSYLPWGDRARYLEQVHPILRVAIALSGPGIVGVVLSLLLEPNWVMQAIGSGFVQILQGTFDLNFALSVLQEAFNTYGQSNDGQRSLLMLLLAKLIALNLLPLFPFNGANIFKDLFILIRGSEIKVWPPLVHWSVLFSLGIVVMWSLAGIGFLARLYAYPILQ